jgi:isopenicillin-N epimerase
LSVTSHADRAHLPAQGDLRRARAAGIVNVIDNAHAVGQIPLDMQNLSADFYASNCHKWRASPPSEVLTLWI